MALITLTSASGSPGVTTTAVGLALCWPRPVLLVEADPTGGSAIAAGYLRGGTAPTDSLIDLAFAHRDGTLVDAIPSVTTSFPDTAVTLIPVFLAGIILVATQRLLLSAYEGGGVKG